MIDAGTAKAQKFAVGDPIDIAFQSGKETFTIVGIVSFGSADNLAGATLAIFDLKEAQRLFGMPGKLSGISIAAAMALVGIVWMALRARGQPVVSGREQMLGSIGEAVGDFDRRGTVHVHGERWQAVTQAPLRSGEAVQVTGIDSLILTVKLVPGAMKGES